MCVKGREKDVNLHRTYLKCRVKNKTKKDRKKVCFKKKPQKRRFFLVLCGLFRAWKETCKDHNACQSEFSDRHLWLCETGHF